MFQVIAVNDIVLLKQKGSFIYVKTAGYFFETVHTLILFVIVPVMQVKIVCKFVLMKKKPWKNKDILCLMWTMYVMSLR